MMGTVTLHTILPVSWLTPAVSHSKDYDLRREILIQVKGKLPESVFSEIGEVDWPALWRFRDPFYRMRKGTFKVNRSNHAALAVPSERRKILLFRLRMKSNRLTCHAAVYVPFAGRLPKTPYSLFRTERHRSGARPLAAKRHRRLDQRLYPDWRSSFRLTRPAHSQARRALFGAIRGLLAS
jgi:hypothetical protein